MPSARPRFHARSVVYCTHLTRGVSNDESTAVVSAVPSRALMPCSCTLKCVDGAGRVVGVNTRTRVEAHRNAPGSAGARCTYFATSARASTADKATTGRSKTQRSSDACAVERNCPLGEASTTWRWPSSAAARSDVYGLSAVRGDGAAGTEGVVAAVTGVPQTAVSAAAPSATSDVT